MAVLTSSAGNLQVTKNTLAHPYVGVKPLATGSGNVANAEAKATLTPRQGDCVYLCGLVITGCGATVSLPVMVQVTGLAGGTRQFVYVFSDAPKDPNQTLNLAFIPPLAASGINTPIVITCPASGNGGLYNMIFTWGYSSEPPE